MKKVGALKIVHEKFKKKASGIISNDELNFRSTFDDAVEMDPYLKNYVVRAQEDLNPIIVKELLMRIPSDV